jgi:type II secretory pathway pseudopilin PulG
MTPARSAFTLMELLVTMLLIITILAFGVPALFSSERKAGVSDGIRSLVNLHERAMKWQRLAAATKSGLVYQITINSTTAPFTASLSNSTLTNVPIDGDGVVLQITGAPATISYDTITGFPSIGSRISIVFKTSTTAAKAYARTLNIYPLGFTEDIQ